MGSKESKYPKIHGTQRHNRALQQISDSREQVKDWEGGISHESFAISIPIYFIQSEPISIPIFILPKTKPEVAGSTSQVEIPLQPIAVMPPIALEAQPAD